MPRYEEWKRRAACAGIEDPDRIFFPPSVKGHRTDTREAKSICAKCPVRKTCLAYAVVYREPRGVWGGMSESERKAIPHLVRKQWREVWYRVHPNSRVHITVVKGG